MPGLYKANFVSTLTAESNRFNTRTYPVSASLMNYDKSIDRAEALFQP